MAGFRIIVCLKQVPATQEVKIDPERGTLIREGIEVETNPFDLNALEEAVRLKERFGGKVIALSMGPPQAESTLREALAIGADEAILLSDRALAGADTLATSYTLACAIRKIGEFDLIFCGEKTTDGDTAQVGPELAENLGIPFVPYVRKIEEIGDRHLIVHREIEEGFQVVQVPIPCLLTVTKDINEPRLPSLKDILRAKRAEIKIWTAADLSDVCEKGRFGLEGSPTRVIKVETPPEPSKGEILEGDPKELAKKLVEKVIELGLVR
ncbi:MAG: electron transfer flavoprotein subunit beta [Thermoproteota archaeon]|nr:MAG: electron transfer flavoprotein subunit beta [Candidatus Korarchaeota archaeon]